MQLWLKALLLSVLAFGASWSSAIWYWRSTNRMPATSELATALVVLPLALVLGCWAAAKGVTLWKGRDGAAPEAAPQEMPAAGATDPVAPALLTIAAAALRVPHAESAAELADALASHSARPGLDASLQDDDGYPVMCARAGYIDEAATEDEFNQWRQDSGLPPLAAQAEFWRALALATPVARDLALAAASHAALAGGAPAHPPQAIPMLQLALLAPPEWPAAWREAACQWLLQQVVDTGWPRQRSAVTAYPDAPAPLLAALHGGGQPCLALVLACASHVGGATVRQWAAANTLFTAKQPQGLMPGEAAAGLLLASSEHAAQLAALPDHAPQLAAIHLGNAGATATQLVQLAQAACHTEPEPQATVPALIVADTGHRSARVMELMAAAHALLPELDPTRDIATLGGATGHAGGAGALAALAMGAHEAQVRNAPVLCLTNEDPQQRCAAVIRPAASVTPGT